MAILWPENLLKTILFIALKIIDAQSSRNAFIYYIKIISMRFCKGFKKLANFILQIINIYFSDIVFIVVKEEKLSEGLNFFVFC